MRENRGEGRKDAIDFEPSFLGSGGKLLFLLVFVILSSFLLSSCERRSVIELGKGQVGQMPSAFSEALPPIEEQLSKTAGVEGAPFGEAAERASSAVSSMSASVFATPAYAQEKKPKIIFTGEISIKVQDLLQSAEKVMKLLPEYGGYVSERTDVTTGSAQSISIKVRVPNEKLFAFTDELKKLGEVLRYNVAGQEVTEEFIDLEARLKQLKLSEERLMEIMSRSGKLTELLEVERELTNKQSQIEQIEGRLRYLSDRVAMATLSIMLVTEAPPVQVAGFTWGFGETFKAAWLSLKSTIRDFAKAGIWVVVYSPIWLVVLLMLSLIYLGWKRLVSGHISASRKRGTPI